MAGIEGRSKGTHNDDKKRSSDSTDVAAAYEDNKRLLVHTLRCCECLPYLTNVVDGFDREFQDKLRHRDRNKGQQDANELFLCQFDNSEDPGKWRALLNAFEKVGYEMLHKLLTGRPVNKDREHYVKLVDILAPVIQKSIDPLELLDPLRNSECLNGHDVQNIERVTENDGNMDGVILLLSRVTRLKDDWFHGFMTALFRSKKLTLMKELDPDFAEKIIEENQGQDTCTSDNQISEDLSSLRIDEQQRAHGMSSTVTTKEKGRREPKQLVLRDYQEEMSDPVKLGQNTLIITPKGIGRQYTTLKIIQEHYSTNGKIAKKVAVLEEKRTVAEKFHKRCLRYLSQLKSWVIVGSEKCNPPPEVCSSTEILITDACCFENMLSSGILDVLDFSMVVININIERFFEQDCGSRKLMERKPSYDAPFPQIVVYTPTVCSDPIAEDSYSNIMDICTAFHIDRISHVVAAVSSLCEKLDLPATELILIADGKDDTIVRSILHLMKGVENVIKETYERLKVNNPQNPMADMSELLNPPENKTDVKYMAWLKTNSTTVKVIIKKKFLPAQMLWTCWDLLEMYQKALLISKEWRGSDAVRYLREKINSMVPVERRENLHHQLRPLLREFEDKYRQMAAYSSKDDPVAVAMKQALSMLIPNSDQQKRVVVVMKYPETVSYVERHLSSELSSDTMSFYSLTDHHRGRKAVRDEWVDGKHNVLITTSNLLLYQFGVDFEWDCVVRADISVHYLMTWRLRDGLTTYGRFISGSGIPNLVLESTIEKNIQDIISLQMSSQNEYRAKLVDLRTVITESDESHRYFGWTEDPHNNILSQVEFYCHGCGGFVLNFSLLRHSESEKLWLGLDRNLLHKFLVIRHPMPVEFSSNKVRKVARMVCKECGQKWGIIASMLGRFYPAFTKEALEIFNRGELIEYKPQWSKAGIRVIRFDTVSNARASLPSTLQLDGKPLREIL